MSIFSTALAPTYQPIAGVGPRLAAKAKRKTTPALAMPLVQQRAEERYRVRGFDRPGPIAIVGFASVYDWPHHAGFADSSGNFRFHRFTPQRNRASCWWTIANCQQSPRPTTER
jgi:hypothetical protein